MRGISGSLVPSAFLEEWLQRDLAAARNHNERRTGVAALVRWWHDTARRLGPASSTRAVFDIAVLPLLNVLGYQPLHVEKHGNNFVGVIGADRRALAALVTLPWDGDLDHGWRDAVRAGRTGGAPWGLVCNARSLRLIDADRPWARRGLGFEFAEVLSSEPSAHALWRLVRAAALDAGDCESDLHSLIKQADQHGVSVCTSLGDGVLDALTCLLGALATANHRRTAKAQSPAAVFEQALTVVYRLLFLLFAEAHAAVPTWHRVYRDAYSIGRLCRRRARQTDSSGVWQSVQAISRLAHAGCRAGDLQVTAFNGRLFSPRHTPLAESARVPNAVMQRTLGALVWVPGGDGRRPIAYADLGVEQLGAVYERVLEYEPVRTKGPAVLTRTSQERKSTGSFYTPRSITEFLVRRTLHPLVVDRTADEILSLRIIDPAMGSGAFLVAACRYLAAAAEGARLAHDEWREGEVTPAQRRELRRTVAQRCLYGVDSNPMAVQLARLSMWLTTLAADRPLTFLDHHLACGDSLIGAALHDLARRTPGHNVRRGPGREALPLFGPDVIEAMAAHVLPDRYRLAFGAEDTAADVRAKERALAALNTQGAPLARWKEAADLWCAAWFWSGTPPSSGEFGDLLSAVLGRQPLLSRGHAQQLLRHAADIARTLRAFHWELEFPEVFFGDDGRRLPDGGFDALITNPPWDVLRADAGNAAQRDEQRRSASAQLRFFRDSGVYRVHGSGHANRYQLFVERALQLARPDGRLGLILPSGFATDHGSSGLRRAVLDDVHIDRVLGFHNGEGIFPIHRDVRFLLLTGTTRARTDRLSCRFGATNAAWLDTLPDAAGEDPPEARPIVLSRAVIDAWDPDYATIPELASPVDLAILVHVSGAMPKLADPNGWGVRFGRELNASDDRRHFVERTSAADHLPILEGKHLEPFRAMVTSAPLAIPLATARTLLAEEATFARPRIGYREIASATNRLTLIAAILPARTLSTHTIFCLKTALTRADQYCLLALLNSLVANYLVRLQVTTHVTAGLMARVPVPRPAAHLPARRELIALAKELETTGIDNHAAYARLNAISAHLYGLSREQFEHVVKTFPLLNEDVRAACVAAF